MIGTNPPPPKTLEDYWNEFQDWLAKSRSQLQGNAYSLGLTRQQQQNSPTNQWLPQQNLTYDAMRPWLGDNAINSMEKLNAWYQNKAIPFWQSLTSRK